MYNQNQTFSSHQYYRDEDKFSCSRILSEGEFQLTLHLSARILGKVVKEVEKYSTLVPYKLQKTQHCKSFKETLS